MENPPSSVRHLGILYLGTHLFQHAQVENISAETDSLVPISISVYTINSPITYCLEMLYFVKSAVHRNFNEIFVSD